MGLLSVLNLPELKPDAASHARPSGSPGRRPGRIGNMPTPSRN